MIPDLDTHTTEHTMNTASPPRPADTLAEDIAAARNSGPSLDAAALARTARIVDALSLAAAPRDHVAAVVFGDSPAAGCAR